MTARMALVAAREAFEMIQACSPDPLAKSLAVAALARLSAYLDVPSPDAHRKREERRRKRESRPSVDVTGRHGTTADVTGCPVRGEGGDLPPDLKSPEGEVQERDVTDGHGTYGTYGTHKVAPVDRYRACYEAGIRDATGKPFAMPRKQEGELHQAIQAFSAGKRGPDLDTWIRQHAGKFAGYVLHLPESERGYWSNFAPGGFLRWLNAGALPVPPPSHTRPSAVQPVPATGRAWKVGQ